MDTKQHNRILHIDRHEVSISFSDKKNTAVINQIQQILLSSFMANVSQPSDILAICPKPGDT